MAKFYVTTPIYYVNAPLHLGHAYATISCDTLARWRRLKGDEVFFLTGTDEHGGNIEKIASENGKSPQEWVDEMSARGVAFFRGLGISNDDFIRTTEERHRLATEAFWKKVAGNRTEDGREYIYKGEYEGWYCRSCEAYFVESELVDGRCPIHPNLRAEKIKEETYFFRLSAFQGYFEDLFSKQKAKPAEERLVVPDVRFNEVYGLIKDKLRDVSITRTKIKWGFKVPGDPEHVIYVWFDALINYLTAIGYPDVNCEKFKRYWPAEMHVIGKEIMRFHVLLWPAMLKAAGLDLPKKVAAHGFWTIDGEKMGKSAGNAIDPRACAKEYSCDALRYFLLREIPFGHDGDFSMKRLIERYNADLANDFGNLAHRTMSMAHRYLNGQVRVPGGESPWEAFIRNQEDWKKQEGDKAIIGAIEAAAGERLSFVQAAFECFAERPLRVPQFQDALNDMWRVIKHGHKYLDTQAPWNQPKEKQEEVLGHVLVLLEAASWPLKAFMPEKAAELRRQLGMPPDERPQFDSFKLIAGDPLFPRIDTKKKG